MKMPLAMEAVRTSETSVCFYEAVFQKAAIFIAATGPPLIPFSVD